MEKDEDDKMFEIMKGLADNAFEQSTSFAKKSVLLVAGYLLMGFIVVFIWLTILTILIYKLF